MVVPQYFFVDINFVREISRSQIYNNGCNKKVSVNIMNMVLPLHFVILPSKMIIRENKLPCQVHTNIINIIIILLIIVLISP